MTDEEYLAEQRVEAARLRAEADADARAAEDAAERNPMYSEDLRPAQSLAGQQP